MERKSTLSHSVALLATGDEIINGDIVNSNAVSIAQRLFNHGIDIGMHLVIGDQIDNIEMGIRFLLQSHRGLIITGGLGPTSDDLTRYALSNALKRELIFHPMTWEHIVSRLQSLGYSTPPENNRQQALFPEGTTIIHNANGTAAGAMIQEKDQFIFMLPGPPLECLPMIDEMVLPTLIAHDFERQLFHEKWLLFGVSEGKIAEELDAIAKPFSCTTGYRFWYPYIEFKLYSEHQNDFNTLLPKIKQAIAPYIISDGKQKTSTLLIQYLETFTHPLTICDFATGGLLESILKTPDTSAILHFSYEPRILPDTKTIIITGLDDFWKNKNNSNTTINIAFSADHQITETIPFRGIRVKQYAIEYICKEIYYYLTNHAS